MKVDVSSTVSAALVLQASFASAKHSHQHIHAHAHDRRHIHHNRHEHVSRAETGESLALGLEEAVIQKRGVQCQFPTDAGLVAVTPGSLNAGWAMSPDQACTPGTYCPYACPPGQMMAQWNPSATAYVFPLSMVRDLPTSSDRRLM